MTTKSGMVLKDNSEECPRLYLNSNSCFEDGNKNVVPLILSYMSTKEFPEKFEEDCIGAFLLVLLSYIAFLSFCMWDLLPHITQMSVYGPKSGSSPSSRFGTVFRRSKSQFSHYTMTTTS